jgi:hypothetical protein
LRVDGLSLSLDVHWSQHWPETSCIIFPLADRAHSAVRAFLIANETSKEYCIVVES